VVPALVAGNFLAFAAASGDDDRLMKTFAVVLPALLLLLAVAALGAWRVYQEYTRSKKLW